MTPGGPVSVDLLSGAKLVIGRAEFPYSLGLLTELLKTTEGMPSATDFLSMEMSNARDILVRAVTSVEAQKLLFKCLEQCTYQSVKITPALFDDPGLGDQAREDYFQIAAEVVKVNCGPFVKRIASLLKAVLGKTAPASPA
jgi:hypothetical protein